MYAIVATGGKQYKAEVNKVIKVEKLGVEVGATVKLDVLMLVDGDKVVAGAAAAKSVVNAEVLAQDKANKVVVFKYKAKKNERKRQGHRQPFTVLKIKEIKA
ncbi:MAG: 50S ribosomal protein L21 [Clostridia bacterium]|nr:50S ribosomal protein L21 [Clostridia bacterium]